MASGVEGDPDTDGDRGMGVPDASGELLLGRQDVQPTSDKLDASCDLKSCPVSCPKPFQVDIHCDLLQSMMGREGETKWGVPSCAAGLSAPFPLVGLSQGVVGLAGIGARFGRCRGYLIVRGGGYLTPGPPSRGRCRWAGRD